MPRVGPWLAGRSTFREIYDRNMTERKKTERKKEWEIDRANTHFFLSEQRVRGERERRERDGRSE